MARAGIEPATPRSPVASNGWLLGWVARSQVFRGASSAPWGFQTVSETVRAEREASPLARLAACSVNVEMTFPLSVRGVPASKDGRFSGDPLLNEGQHMCMLSRRIGPGMGDALVAYYWLWRDRRFSRPLRLRLRRPDDTCQDERSTDRAHQGSAASIPAGSPQAAAHSVSAVLDGAHERLLDLAGCPE